MKTYKRVMERLMMISLLTLWVGSAWSTIHFDYGRDYGVGLQAGYINNGGDLNNDGYPDFLVTNSSSNSITIGYNDGNGSFKLKDIVLANSRKYPVASAVGDLDGDGLNDIVLANVQTMSSGIIPLADCGIIFMYAKADGTFDQLPSVSIRGTPSFIVIADINGDKKNDIVIGNLGANQFEGDSISQYDTGIDVFTNQGGRNFSGPQSIDNPGSVCQVIVDDLDGDGFPDVLAVDQGTQGVDPIRLIYTIEGENCYFLNGSASGFKNDNIYTNDFTQTPWSADVADFDGDGKKDLALALVGDADPQYETSFLGKNASIRIYNYQNKDFHFVQSIPVPGIAYWVMAGDFNLDGTQDLAVTCEELPDGIPHLIFFENKAGVFTQAQSVDIDFNLPRYAFTADLDQDGDLDVVVLSTQVDATSGFGMTQPVNGNVRVFFNSAKTDVAGWWLY